MQIDLFWYGIRHGKHLGAYHDSFPVAPYHKNSHFSVFYLKTSGCQTFGSTGNSSSFSHIHYRTEFSIVVNLPVDRDIQDFLNGVSNNSNVRNDKDTIAYSEWFLQCRPWCMLYHSVLFSIRNFRYISLSVGALQIFSSIGWIR